MGYREGSMGSSDIIPSTVAKQERISGDLAMEIGKDLIWVKNICLVFAVFIELLKILFVNFFHVSVCSPDTLLQKRSPRDWQWQKSFNLSLSKLSQLSSPHLLVTFISYSFTLFYLPTSHPLQLGLSISLIYTF